MNETLNLGILKRPAIKYLPGLDKEGLTA